jgi:hypothetical protein
MASEMAAAPVAPQAAVAENEQAAPRKRKRDPPSSDVRTQRRYVTARRKSLFMEVFDEAVETVPHDFTVHLSNFDCWYRVGSHHFKKCDPSDQLTRDNMLKAISEWIRLAAPIRAPAAAAPAPARAAAAPALARATAAVALARAAPVAAAPSPTPTISRLVHVPPNLADISAEVLEVLGQITAGISDIVELEEMFENRGLGRSGPQCPICMEPKTTRVAFSRNCDHWCCAECSSAWIKFNNLATGARCPGCAKDNIKAAEDPAQAAEVGNFADPQLMFGAKKLEIFNEMCSFAAFQIPFLQRELDALGPSPTAERSGQCPLCRTVTTARDGENCLRRCHNPRCSAVYCLHCNSSVDGGAALQKRHLSGDCSVTVAETKFLMSQKGNMPCSKCGTALWHARGHGCHHVQCPVCSHTQCHTCGLSYTATSGCSCKLFCVPGEPCNCSDECPECRDGHGPCSHCSGNCPSCVARPRRE